MSRIRVAASGNSGVTPTEATRSRLFPPVLKSLISAVCYCLYRTRSEKERDTRGCPRCRAVIPLDSHTSSLFLSYSVNRQHLQPAYTNLRSSRLGLLVLIFGFLLSMFLTMRESLLSRSTLGLIHGNTGVAVSVANGDPKKRVTERVVSSVAPNSTVLRQHVRSSIG